MTNPETPSSFVGSYVPSVALRPQVARDLRSVFNTAERGEALERLNCELHRRTRVATLFPNEASLLRLVSAMAAEISEEWETGRIYLNPESE